MAALCRDAATPIADDEAASGAPERFAFRQRANGTQAFGHDAQAWAKYRIRLTRRVWQMVIFDGKSLRLAKGFFYL
jgi:hypothetical protein